MAIKYKWWITLIVVLQLLFSVMALYALHMVGQAVLFSADKPTPTCPEGVSPWLYITLEVGRRCAAERAELYSPQWANVVSRGAVPLYLLCFGCGLLAKSLLRRRGLFAPRRKSVDIQIWILSTTLVLHLLVFPNNWLWLFRYIVFGVEYAIP